MLALRNWKKIYFFYNDLLIVRGFNPARNFVQTLTVACEAAHAGVTVYTNRTQLY